MATPKKKRLKGTGGIVKQASGNYAFQYKDASGKRVTRSLKTKNRKEAQAKAQEYERGLTARDTIDALHEISRARELIDSRTLPISEVWKAFLATNPTAGDGTLSLYRRALKDFEGWLIEDSPSVGDFSLINKKIAGDWLAAVWGRGVSASTFNDKRGALALIHKKLKDSYNLSGNPWLEIERQKGPQQKRLALTNDQIQQIIEIDAEKDVRAILFLGLFAGMRLGDAVSLKQVSIKESKIEYTPAKTALTTGAVAKVPIFPILYEALEPYLGGEPDDSVFPDLAAGFLRNPDSLKAHLLELIHSVTGAGAQSCKGQSLRKRSLYGFHSLRHTFATEASRAGVDSVFLELMTGDTLQTLQKYYVQINDFGVEPAKAFEKLPLLLAHRGQQNSKREELKRLAEDLPIKLVEELIAVATKQLNSTTIHE